MSSLFGSGSSVISRSANRVVHAYTVLPSTWIMHSLQALALIQEKRIAKLGSRCTRIQRRPSSTVWPASNGTSKRSYLLPRRIFSSVFKPDSIGAEPQQLMALPGIARLGKILSLMRAAAFGAFERGPRHAFRDQRHVAQVVQIEPLGVEAAGRR